MGASKPSVQAALALLAGFGHVRFRTAKGHIMDYSKMGGGKGGSNKPRHREHNEPGSTKTPYGKKPVKEELLERMKKAAKKKG